MLNFELSSFPKGGKNSPSIYLVACEQSPDVMFILDAYEK